MKTSQNGIDLIKSFEGCVLNSYTCTAGVWTIGYGHTAGVYAGMKITQSQAEQYLKQDLQLYENYVNLLNLPLNQNQFDALVSFTYNCGAGSLKTLTNGRSLSQIADALLLYNKDARKKVQDGLNRRRKAERELFLKNSNVLPYYVKTTSDLNIREDAGTASNIIGLAKKGTILKVWAIKTLGTVKWGKNEQGFFCLNYTETL